MNEPLHPRAVARETIARQTQRASDGFNFTEHLRRLCGDMVERLPQLSHIELDALAFAFAQTRKSTEHGLYASLTPMRFENGAREGISQGRRYRIDPLMDQGGRELLYILTVYLPRFMDLGFREKLITILHELWHISPAFDGDLRRHEGRCYAHSHSQKQYDVLMSELATQWMAAAPSADLYRFLDLDFAELQARYGRVYGRKIARPRLIPMD